MTARSFFPFAIKAIRIATEELEASFMNQRTGKIESGDIRDEVKANRRWIRKAQKELSVRSGKRL